MPSPLWDFALEKYRLPHVADLCIQLQDEHDASVCELLWAAWLADQGRQVDAQALADYRRLRQGLYLSIIRLRGARRLLELDPATRELGRQTRPLEIEAEKHLLSELEGLASQPLTEDPFHALHKTRSVLGLEPNADAQRLYIQLTEHLALAGVQIDSSHKESP